MTQLGARRDEFELSPEGLSDLIGLVYDSALEERQWQALIDRLSELFPHCCIVVMGFNGKESHSPYAYSGMTLPEFRRVAPTIEHANDIVADRYQEISDLPLGFITRSYVVYTDQELARTNMYRSFFEPLGCRHFFNLKFASYGVRNATIGFTLTPGADAHHLSLFNVLKLISPHIVRGMQISRAMKLANGTSDRFGFLLDAIALPLIAVNGQSEVLFANVTGYNLLNSGNIFGVDGVGKLKFQDEGEMCTFRHSVMTMEENNLPTGICLNRNNKPVSLCLVPINSKKKRVNQIDHDLLADDCIFAIFVGVQNIGHTDVDLLLTVFSLTKREAEVCGELLLGSSPQDIALNSERSIKTVRNHIQSILEKVGVKSVASLLEALTAFRAVGADCTTDSDSKASILSSRGELKQPIRQLHHSNRR